MFNNRMEEWINACPRVKFTSWEFPLCLLIQKLPWCDPLSLLSAQDHQQESKSEESDPRSYAGPPPLGVGAGVALFLLHHLPRRSLGRALTEYAEIRIKWGTEGSMSLSGPGSPVSSAGRRTHRLILRDLTSPSAVGPWITACKFLAICLRLCNHRYLGSHPCSFIY